MTAKFEFYISPQSIDKTKTETMSFWIFLPSDYKQDGEKRFPLLIYQHGSGNPTLEGVKYGGPAGNVAVPGEAEKWQFITVSPLGGWTPQQLLRFIDELEKRYKIDLDRIYLTGFSAGGSWAWFTAMAAPKRFAAVVPLAGVSAISEAERLVDLSLWAHVGAEDSPVIVDFNKKMAEAVEKQGGKKIKLSVYPNVGHDVTSTVYSNPEFYRWLLEQRRSPSSP
jgi:predicted peptidase